MKTAIICALGALALTACQRAGEETTADDDAGSRVIDAVPSEAEPYRAAAEETPPPAPARSQRPSRKAAADIAAEKAAAEIAAAPPAAADLPGPSEAARDEAQQAAEETNLHPRTP